MSGPAVQVPLSHVYSVRSRVCAAVSSQVVENPKQGLHPVKVSSAHIVPSVARMHPCVSTVSALPHVPLEQVKSVRVRDSVPDSSQGPAKSPHAPHPVKVAIAQVSPLVVREQPCISIVGVLRQDPLAQRSSVRVRVCVPDVSQRLLKLPQAPHSPTDVDPHMVPVVLREHERTSVSIVALQVRLTQLYVVRGRIC